MKWEFFIYQPSGTLLAKGTWNGESLSVERHFIDLNTIHAITILDHSDGGNEVRLQGAEYTSFVNVSEQDIEAILTHWRAGRVS